MEYTGCGNTEHKGLQDCLDCHLAQISLRVNMFFTVMEVKGLAILSVRAKMLSCKLPSTTAACVLYIL
jgi:hypothetical protein